jgi:hypothetical protein
MRVITADMRSWSAAPALVLLAACASVDGSRRIDAQDHWYGTTYAQDGRQVSAFSLRSQLDGDAAARPHMERYRSYERWTLPLGAAGGAAFGWGSANVLGGNTGQWPFLAAGVAALVPLAIAAPAQNRALRDAVEAHNAALARAAADAAARASTPAAARPPLSADGSQRDSAPPFRSP